MEANQNFITIYHGSLSEVPNPMFGEGKPYNDYGLGFYCTENIEMAKEWACSKKKHGFVNTYTLDVSGLNGTNLNSSDYSVLHWITVLLQNRKFDTSELGEEVKAFLTDNYRIDGLGVSDTIKGYRADDSYFSYAEDFVNNTLSINRLETAMKLGNLGEQVVLISKQAFERLKFVKSEKVDAEIYYPKWQSRDEDARAKYRAMRKEGLVDGVYALDIIRRNAKI
ncbi:MAG: DUF3990 domain-containing protein [Oscillospiraceae bacterium]|nr:DUF3990 domain-containing protein [Oscillospiraceae bacterium]